MNTNLTIGNMAKDKTAFGATIFSRQFNSNIEAEHYEATEGGSLLDSFFADNNVDKKLAQDIFLRTTPVMESRDGYNLLLTEVDAKPLKTLVSGKEWTALTDELIKLVQTASRKVI